VPSRHHVRPATPGPSGGSTPRQREILDQLGGRFNKGFAGLTMAELASSLNCSLRTLYAIAPSRDELVVLVIDRNRRGFGRRALAAVTPDMTALEAIRAYPATATTAVHRASEQFARDLQEVPAATASHSTHNDYLVAVTQALLDLAVDRGEIEPVDNNAMALVMALLGRDFAEPDVLARLDASPKETAGQVLDVLLRGLIAGR